VEDFDNDDDDDAGVVEGRSPLLISKISNTSLETLSRFSFHLSRRYGGGDEAFQDQILPTIFIEKNSANYTLTLPRWPSQRESEML
jgi:hypothetical protein